MIKRRNLTYIKYENCFFKNVFVLILARIENFLLQSYVIYKDDVSIFRYFPFKLSNI